jgi:hypothetical protein
MQVANVLDATLFIKTGDWLGSDCLTTRRNDCLDGNISIDGLDCRLDHFAAIVPFGDNPVGAPAPVSLNSLTSPDFRAVFAAQIRQNVTDTSTVNATDDNPGLVAVLVR